MTTNNTPPDARTVVPGQAVIYHQTESRPGVNVAWAPRKVRDHFVDDPTPPIKVAKRAPQGTDAWRNAAIRSVLLEQNIAGRAQFSEAEFDKLVDGLMMRLDSPAENSPTGSDPAKSWRDEPATCPTCGVRRVVVEFPVADCIKCGNKLEGGADSGVPVTAPNGKKLPGRAHLRCAERDSTNAGDRCPHCGVEDCLSATCVVFDVLRRPEGQARLLDMIRDNASAIRMLLGLPLLPSRTPEHGDRMLQPGDLWQDPEGTEYIVVTRAEAGDRPRWDISAGTMAGEVGLETRAQLYGLKRPSDDPRWPLALVIRSPGSS